MDSVENLSSSLVREYLSRKGLRETLEMMDKELPRTSERTMIEVIVQSLINVPPRAPSPSAFHQDSKPITSINIDSTMSYQPSSPEKRERDSFPKQQKLGIGDADVSKPLTSPVSRRHLSDISGIGGVKGSIGQRVGDPTGGRGVKMIIGQKLVDPNVHPGVKGSIGQRVGDPAGGGGVKTIIGQQFVDPAIGGGVKANIGQRIGDSAMGVRVKPSSGQRHGVLSGLNETALPSQRISVNIAGTESSQSSGKSKLKSQRNTELNPMVTDQRLGESRELSLFTRIDLKQGKSLPVLSSSLSSPQSKTRSDKPLDVKLDKTSKLDVKRDDKLVLEELEDLDLQVDLPKFSHSQIPKIRVEFPLGIPISSEESKALRKLLFGNSSSKEGFSSEWMQQNLIFCDVSHLEYGLVQHKGGPCGVLASLQAYILLYLLFKDPSILLDGAKSPRPTFEERNRALVSGMAEIIWQAGDQKTGTIALLNTRHRSLYGSNTITDKLNLFSFDKKNHMTAFIESYLDQFTGDHCCGCVLFIVSVIITRGIAQVCSDMDEMSTGLIGAHGYCAQELVNLLLTGTAVSNVFDGVIGLDTGEGQKNVLKGIEKKCDVGLLSLFEHFDSCKVGKHYKNPTYPVFVVCSESHFLVLFSTVKDLIKREELQKCFDLYYYDGLSNQKEPIRLTIRTGELEATSKDTALTPPIELCIRTRWDSSVIDWNGSEKLL